MRVALLFMQALALSHGQHLPPWIGAFHRCASETRGFCRRTELPPSGRRPRTAISIAAMSPISLRRDEALDFLMRFDTWNLTVRSLHPSTLATWALAIPDIIRSSTLISLRVAPIWHSFASTAVDATRSSASSRYSRPARMSYIAACNRSTDE